MHAARAHHRRQGAGANVRESSTPFDIGRGMHAGQRPELEWKVVVREHEWTCPDRSGSRARPEETGQVVAST
jgi:hypothetical protein